MVYLKTWFPPQMFLGIMLEQGHLQGFVGETMWGPYMRNPTPLVFQS